MSITEEEQVKQKVDEWTADQETADQATAKQDQFSGKQIKTNKSRRKQNKIINMNLQTGKTESSSRKGKIKRMQIKALHHNIIKKASQR